ncbi:hypothetical protein SNE40_004216 [Patella caerulea]|uniref:Uncharacterized protein n=1 Tax=Patella caerulea TaxID=87958 RepID=A0AAN8KBB4_PATCE
MDTITSQKSAPPFPDSKWKIIVQKHVGRKIGQKYRNIGLHILAVDKGVKCGFLLDFSLTVERLQLFLRELYMEKLIGNGLKIIDIGLDKLIYNVNSLKDAQSKWDEICFIDISKTNKTPCLLESTSDKLLGTRKVFENLDTSNDVAKIDVDNNKLANPSTLFGVQIGYPVVYWYEITGDNSNCLDMEPLKCVQVLCQRHILYSFSVPVCLWDIMENVVTAWFDFLLSKCEYSYFHNLRLKIETVCLPQVCL